MPILAFPRGAVVCNLRVEPPSTEAASQHCSRVTLPRASASCPLEGAIHHSVLRMPSPGAARIRGCRARERTSRVLGFAGLGAGMFADHPILGSFQCLPELISEARKCTCAKPGCTVRCESLRCGPDALCFKTGSSPTRASTRSLRQRGV